MKTRLRKTIITMSIIIGSFSSLQASNENATLSRSVQLNNLGQPELITISKNNKNEKTDNIKQYKLVYNESGKTISKEISEWNKSKKEWLKSVRYIYTYNQDGKFSYQIAQKWDDKSQSWNNIGYMIYEGKNSYLVEK